MMMKMKKRTKAVSLVLAATLTLTACVTAGNSTTGANGQPLTPAEQRMRQQAAVYNQTLLEGGLVGCGIGVLGGLLASSKENRGKNAAIGCAAGAVVGVTAASYIAEKQQQFATDEARYNAMIADVRQDNSNLSSMITDSRQVIANDRARIDQIDRDLAAGKISMDQARTQIQTVDDNTKYMSQALDTLKKKKETYSEAAKQQANTASAAQRAAMDKEIKTLETQISQLDGEMSRLVQRRSISRVG